MDEVEEVLRGTAFQAKRGQKLLDCIAKMERHHTLGLVCENQNVGTARPFPTKLSFPTAPFCEVPDPANSLFCTALPMSPEAERASAPPRVKFRLSPCAWRSQPRSKRAVSEESALSRIDLVVLVGTVLYARRSGFFLSQPRRQQKRPLSRVRMIPTKKLFGNAGCTSHSASSVSP